MVGAGKYKIDLLKVKEADVYNFEIDSAFFSAFEESTIKNGEIDRGLMIKASSKAGGDEKKAESLWQEIGFFITDYP